MKKSVIKIIAYILIILLPIAIYIIVVESQPNQYENTYLAELSDKYNYLIEEDNPKIVFVGGSSLPFGIRSDLIEQYTGYKVVNFGLYATLGTKFMMDLSKANINKGDVIILSPEVNEQTYSLYFNPTAILQACDGFSNKNLRLSIKENISLFYNYFSYSFDKIKYINNKNAPDPVGIYRHDSFNKYGDIFVERAYNIMRNRVDTTNRIIMDETIYDESFINYVNQYIRYVEKKGARIFFNYSPCNHLAVRTSSSNRAAFDSKLKSIINCDFLLGIEDAMVDCDYFYDTNYHLNTSGAIYYTNIIINSLCAKLGIEIENKIEVPAPPRVPEEGTVIVKESNVEFNKYKGEPNVDYIDCFDYVLSGTTYQIVDVKDEYSDMEQVILPSVYNGKNITAISEYALNKMHKLKYVYIGNTYKTLSSDAFNGCEELRGIYLYQMDGNQIIPDSVGLLNGVNSNVKIYIPEGANYKMGYIWANYSNFMRTFILNNEI